MNNIKKLLLILLIIYILYDTITPNYLIEPMDNHVPNLYCFWTGTNELTDNRKRNLETLKNTGFNVILITPDNLKKYILKNHPLHRGYQYLSETHKSDYLRCYFMNFYGGGYSDIKIIEENWIDYYNKLMNSDKWGYGYIEGPPWIPWNSRDKNLSDKLNKNYKDIIGVSKFIMKPNTQFTNEWYKQVMNKMDSIYDDLKKYPSKSPQQEYTKDYPYPLRWIELLGDIFYPLALKHKDEFNKDMPQINIDKYR